MSSVQSTLSSPRTTKILFWVAAAVLAAGIAVLVIKLSDRGSSSSAAPKHNPAVAKNQGPNELPGAHGYTGPPVKKLKDVPAQALTAVRTFILGAAGRENLAAAWRVSAPEIKNGQSRKEWMTGNIGVVWFPAKNVDAELKGNTSVVKGSTMNEITLLMGITPKDSTGMKPASFWVGVHPVGKGANQRWLVDYFFPKWSPKLPDTTH